jgi:hypothetical protein
LKPILNRWLFESINATLAHREHDRFNCYLWCRPRLRFGYFVLLRQLFFRQPFNPDLKTVTAQLVVYTLHKANNDGDSGLAKAAQSVPCRRLSVAHHSRSWCTGLSVAVLSVGLSDGQSPVLRFVLATA